MGCDCHPHIELRGQDGTWSFLRRIWYEEPDPALARLKDRNYKLFGILAGVRGGRAPLFPQRGLPDDTCDEIRTKFKDDADYHSVTWFTVQELLDVDWDQTAGHEELQLDPSSYLKWIEDGRKGNPGDLVIEGKDFEVSEEEMILLLTSGLRTRRTGKTRPTDLHKLKPLQYVEVLSPVSYRDEVPTFVDIVIPALVKLGEPHNVRVVMGFDS